MAATPPDFPYDYFISRRGSIATLAQEAADTLEAVNYKVKVQDYDFAASAQFVADIDDALRQCRHLLILYSADYHDSFWTRQEFHNFLAAVAKADGQRRIGVLRCDAATPTGLMHSATHGDLTNIDDPAKRRDIILSVAQGRAPATRPTPRIFGGTMPLENRLFTGREDLLTALHTELSAPGATAALTQAATYGLGGVGKTSIARAYIARFGNEYANVWWITAADPATTTDGLAALARSLDPRLPTDTPQDQAAKTALATIAKSNDPFLLVYDNAPNPAALTGLLPPRGAHVLITSRHPGWSRQARTLPVAAMPEDDAIALLQRVADRQDPTGARRLANELGCLPLALDQAAAYVRQTHTTFDDYATKAEALIGRAGDNPDYPASVAATIDLAIAATSPTAEAILARFAWLAPDSIPLLLLDDEIAPETQRDEAIAVLTNVSLLTPAPDTEAGPAVTIHRLVQAVMRARLTANNTAETARDQTLARLTDAFPYAPKDPALWPLCRTLLPQVRALESHVSTDRNAPALTTLLNCAAGFLEGSGDAASALPLHRRALEVRERVLGAEHSATLVSVNNLAECLRTLGDAVSALALFRRALEGYELVLGAEHPVTLVSLNNLAHCLQTLGDAALALPLYRRALETRERVLGAEHPDTLISVNNLAWCQQTLGHAALALPLHRRGLEGCERVLGVEHFYTLTSVNNLGLCLQALGDAVSALPLHRRALEGYEHALGAEHPDTLTSVSNLAHCLRTLGDAALALPLYRRGLEGCERVLGAEHPDTLTSVNNLALCLETLDDTPSALPLYRRALEGYERVLGAEHPDTLTSVSNLAGCLGTLGDAASALPLYRRALEGRERVLGAEHPHTLASVNNLAYHLRALGDTSSALPLYRRALGVSERVLGVEHPLTRIVRENFDIASEAVNNPSHPTVNLGKNT